MLDHHPRYTAGALAAAGMLTLAACGAGSGPGNDAAGGKSATGAGGKTVISTSHTNLGTVLVGKSGKTLYLDTEDSGGKSSCTGSCAAIWPAVGAAAAGHGVRAAMLGTTTRDDGSTQATYHGHPLYYYSGDAKAGDTAGQGVEHFFVLRSNGAAVHGRAASAGGYTKDSGGY